ncbi:mannose-1-phosphate guanylyltransferase [bacterium SCSIO 12741]|nr:mannose-1-phosphate guanylyltransferase [bacterium SCSIO 12741]
MNNNYCIIMAGGIGSRFWPWSTETTPKQFLDILGTGKTLIRQTFERFVGLCPAENFYVVTNARYFDLVQEQIPELNPDQILCEPVRRNTAPCIAYASYKIKGINPAANIVVTPADHVILKEEEFQRVIRLGLDHASQSNDLITLGIEPTRPDTGYGYIEFQKSEGQEIHSVEQFREKPDLENAKRFIEAGNFVWNSGVFIWNLQVILQAFENYIPDLHELFTGLESSLNTDNERTVISEQFANSPDISIDYGVMEKADQVKVIFGDFGWSDLGTWGSLFSILDKDEQNNASLGDQVHLSNSTGCIVKGSGKRLVVTEGIDDVIVVDTDDVLLICKKSDEQKIKQLVAKLK